MIVFGGIIVLITTFSLKRLDFSPEAARGDNGFLDPRFCFHLRISCHQKGMILFLGNRWKSAGEEGHSIAATFVLHIFPVRILRISLPASPVFVLLRRGMTG